MIDYSSASTTFNVAGWDYTQRYPNPNSDIESGMPSTDEPPSQQGNVETQQFYADVEASGDLTITV